tara:strand:+ start:186 stop:983 length:798 start_codon:yes stop_codon:yes gene_type:complete
MNFGTLKDIFVERLIESYTTDDTTGKILYKNFIKILKENDTLKTAFIVYKNLESKTIKSESNASDYLKENISFLSNLKDGNSLKEQSKKLISLLKESNIELGGLKTKKIHKSIEDLITIEKNISTIDKLQESKSEVISWLMSDKDIDDESNDKKYVRENIDPNKFLEIAVTKFNDKYKNSLTKEEKEILKVLHEDNEDKTKELVSTLVKETVNLINTHLKTDGQNINIKEKLLETKDVVYKMTENNGNFSNKVLKLYELKKNLIS